jgi:hypothetical protein
MKKILSVSLGSSSRDHSTVHEFLGEKCEISRIGFNADFDKAIAAYKEYDGKVDAFGIGGVEFYLGVGDKRYYFREVKKIRAAIQKSKAGDGNGIKGLLVRRALKALETKLNEEGKTLNGMKALKTNAVDRYVMAAALVEAGCDVTFGDFMFSLGLPFPIHELKTVRLLAATLLPVITQLPFKWFYPLGSAQDKPPEPKWEKYYNEAEIIAGDFVSIRAHMPADMRGKIILTNTTTAKNVEELRERGVHLLVTSTPRLDGRTFGTNVMEATLRALIDKPDEEITEADFLDLIERIPLEPNIEVLN